MLRATRDLLEEGAKETGRASAVVNISSVAGIAGIGSSVALRRKQGRAEHYHPVAGTGTRTAHPCQRGLSAYIDTPWFTKGRGVEQAGKIRDMISEKSPLKVASSAEDVADVVRFLAGPQSRNMTGEIVRIDAGAHLIS